MHYANTKITKVDKDQYPSIMKALSADLLNNYPEHAIFFHILCFTGTTYRIRLRSGLSLFLPKF